MDKKAIDTSWEYEMRRDESRGITSAVEPRVTIAPGTAPHGPRDLHQFRHSHGTVQLTFPTYRTLPPAGLWHRQQVQTCTTLPPTPKHCLPNPSIAYRSMCLVFLRHLVVQRSPTGSGTSILETLPSAIRPDVANLVNTRRRDRSSWPHRRLTSH